MVNYKNIEALCCISKTNIMNQLYFKFLNNPWHFESSIKISSFTYKYHHRNSCLINHITVLSQVTQKYSWTTNAL